MLKKIFIAAFMIMLIVAQNVSAQDVLVYTDEQNDYSYYVDTDSFVNKTIYHDNRAFDVKVTILWRGDSPKEVTYSMWENDGLIWFNNGEGTGMHPVNFEPAESIWNFGLKFLNLDYEVSYK